MQIREKQSELRNIRAFGAEEEMKQNNMEMPWEMKLKMKKSVFQ